LGIVMSELTPLVTIGIPTYNRARLLNRAIESAMAQDYDNLEVVVSDNVSTDGTVEVCREWGARDPRLRYVRQEYNIGATKNFEAVLGLARGEYFMWLGDDDWIDADYVRVCLHALLDDPELALVGGAPCYYEQGLAKGKGQSLSLPQQSWWQRVASYFWQVRDNGIFYGLARTVAVRGLLPMRNAMAGDWLHVAALASQGHLLTVDSTSVHRELGGATMSYGQMVRSLGLHRLAAVFPFAFVAWGAFAGVGWRDAGYKHRGGFARLTVALVVSVTVLVRGAVVATAPARVWGRRILGNQTRRR
jgi:glycosyltransferase involved in cell wall biosynthesis